MFIVASWGGAVAELPPQCAMPDIGFKSKWVFVEGLPVAAVTLFLLFHFIQVVKKRVILGRKSKLNSHVPSLVGTTLVMMYVATHTPHTARSV